MGRFPVGLYMVEVLALNLLMVNRMLILAVGPRPVLQVAKEWLLLGKRSLYFVSLPIRRLIHVWVTHKVLQSFITGAGFIGSPRNLRALGIRSACALSICMRFQAA